MNIYQIDAFTRKVFGGNPAAVIPLNDWLPEELMQQIARENNLSETAFFVKDGNQYSIRWFTPEIEIDLCGHATLASAYVLFEYLGFEKEKIDFIYKGGNLSVAKHGNLLAMDFPAVPSVEAAVDKTVVSAMGKQPLLARKARDLLLLYQNQQDIVDLEPNFVELAQIEHLGIIATAPGEKVDFVSRFFAPRAGINEDPVTGSAHCMLIPFWAERLNKNKMEALQLSARTGELLCEYKKERVVISGQAVTYMIGELKL